jgi:hypothetical protein
LCIAGSVNCGLVALHLAKTRVGSPDQRCILGRTLVRASKHRGPVHDQARIAMPKHSALFFSQ